MDESLWPARNIAEYAYCPRLFYYMEVEGIHVASADTEQGNRVHRRVDKPSQERPDGSEKPDPTRTMRSLTLTSAALQLTATMDLVEIDGLTAVPVEYRKGRPRRVCTHLAPRDAVHRAERDTYDSSGGDDDSAVETVEPWPTDRVQAALQAILLVEAGYEVPEIAIYYAAEKRRVVVPFDEALRSEALATLEAAKQAARGPRPLPLLNDPRCPRCSLLPVCLPDEVHQQRGDCAPTLPAARRLWPPRDEGLHLVSQHGGTRIGVRGAAMQISDENGAKTRDVPLANLESLTLLGGVQISTQAITLLSERGVPIAFLSAGGRLTALVDPLDSVSAETRRAQVHKFDQPESCLELARAVVVAKIANQRKLLMRNHAALPGRVAEALAEEGRRAAQAASIDSLRGHEGQAAALYFANFAGMLKSEVAAEFDANGRQRRPPPDPVNACLSFGYSMLTHECTAALRTGRLEPSIGAYHVSRPGRPALSLDLMEPFRPLIADSIAITAFNRGELQPGHFLRTSAGAMFTEDGRKAFFGVYGRRMDEEVTHPVFDYKLSYRRMLMLHARMIAAWLVGEVPTLAFLTTR
jgi:CRISPR-associated protein Cas1